MVCTAAAAAAVYFVSTSTDVYRYGIGLNVVYLVIPGRYLVHVYTLAPGSAWSRARDY